MLFPNGVPNLITDRENALRAIKCIAAKIEDIHTKYTVSSFTSTTDGVFNYSHLLLSMGLLARDYRDSWKEADGPQFTVSLEISSAPL